MARVYEKKFRPSNFKEGDLVLKNIMPFKEDPQGKFKSKSEDKYNYLTRVSNFFFS